MAQPSLPEITQYNSSVNIINTENNVSVPLRQNEVYLNFRFPILLERYSVLLDTHETIRNEFQALKSGTAIQYSEVAKQNKDLHETNEKLCKANAVLLQISQSGEERQEGAKVSPENLEVLRDTQILNDQLTKDTNNSAKSLSHLEELEKVNKKRLGKISILVERVEGCIGSVCELEEILFRNLNKQCDEARSQILSLQHSLNVLYEKVRHYGHKNFQLQLENGKIKLKYKEEIAKLKRQLKLKDDDVIKAQKQNEKLQEEQKNLEDSLAPDGNEHETLLQRRYRELQELHQHQLKLIQRLEDRIVAQRSEISRLQQEPLQVENTQLNKDLKGANDKINKLESNIQQLKETKINLNKKLRQAKTNYQKFKESNNTLRKEVVDLTNALFAATRPVPARKKSQPKNRPVLLDNDRDVTVDKLQNQPKCYKRKRKQNLPQGDKMIRKALSVPAADQAKDDKEEKT
ncbi:unnamed protein product [Orchesella dallaii]|uniref:Uncharacterized protein n=1 Tax=Orchesella dallaii TaxID=48710 RepID=A0ABP1RHU8_9HEXA